MNIERLLELDIENITRDEYESLVMIAIAARDETLSYTKVDLMASLSEAMNIAGHDRSENES